MKKLITLICCALSAMILLAGCTPAVNLTDEQNAQVNSNVTGIINIVVAQISQDGTWTAYSEADREVQLNLDDEAWEEKQASWKEINNLKFDSKGVYESAINSYLYAVGESGEATSVKETLEYAIVDDNLTVTATLVTAERTVEMVMLYDDDMNITGISFNPVYTMGENMTRATLNTGLGMGTVFTVLILIMFIISSFKIIYNIQNASEKKKASKNIKEDAVDQTIAQIIEKEEYADDLELVAVISAAIAAYEGSSSTEGFVVRSIKKQKKDGWKRAL